MPALVQEGELILSGMVGGDINEGFAASDVVAGLAMLGADADIRVRINSGGGIAWEGAAIHSTLAQHRGRIDVLVEGVAASAASLIAMAGKSITMAAGSVMMIHDPAGWTMGDAEAHRKTIEVLDALGQSYATVYAERAQKSVQSMRQLMRDETWMDGAAAVRLGLADKVETAANDDAPKVAAFAYTMYARAPEKLVAMARENGWEKPRLTAPPAEKTPAQPKDRATEISDICAAAGVPTMAAALIREGLTVEQAKARAGEGKEIRAMVALAAGSFAMIEPSLADEFIAQGFSVEKARSAMFDTIVAKQSPEVDAHIGDLNPPDAKTVLARTVARINAENARNRGAE